MKTILLITILLTTACAGSNFNFHQARQVRVGMTTAELTKAMGSPYMVHSANGKEVWVWVHYNGLTGGMNKVSFIVKEGTVIGVPVIPASFD